jgi:hypothetical protein
MTSDSETSSCEGDDENEVTDLHPPKKRKFPNYRYILRKVKK